MTATPGGFLLLLIVVLFFLHLCWRLTRSRDGSAIACFAAAYMVLALLLDRHPEPVSIAPLLLPFLYPYAWLGLAASMWVPANMRVERRALVFPGRDPRLTALFCSQLALHVGVIGLSPWLEWRPLAVYVLAPPLTAAIGYAAYRMQLLAIRRAQDCRAPWASWAALCLLLPLLLAGVESWLMPLLLNFT
ncbi:hypothetical protein ACPRNU_19330 [Chromobacterium vaccinii]|uniref:hypothetical protein n=1 Tax=Chromobacterium vaccinii TaxID=1108595 RepID=UPI003C7126D5